MFNPIFSEVCPKCAALIAPLEDDKHKRFHEEHEELIEWAQAVSELFPGAPDEKTANQRVADGEI